MAQILVECVGEFGLQPCYWCGREFNGILGQVGSICPDCDARDKARTECPDCGGMVEAGSCLNCNWKVEHLPGYSCVWE
jgi:DNA-directed RNA polymerase subunit RPC12/RpoP